ncbi:SDR family NAD(P)-dependent oxidoreductase [Methylobacterium sp. E-005]|uniref:SDR family NAD(P)-dependent oxidoreductase n=1 Tax=Methylobacterium sp. E-005 TaxID=2836549 RepID=UPI001FBBD2E2|nr:SDR family NAD(P)-dependent oxidoreductase [Methylobacterium sp. E-005]MCJ2088492.1 SDR family NAD(P)-dependent oxidoreductase [Methylobacterium sp. E-005]
MPSDTSRPFAVITGGSNGIGFELARQFAENGHDVLIAAQDEAHLAEAAQRLSGSGAKVLTHASDLSREDGVDSLFEQVRSTGRPVDALCLNAGVGLGGPFVETDLQRELKMIDLNVRGAVQLTKLVLKDMVVRGSGKLLFTSSVEASMPDPFEAIYGSTKVFLRWFGESLRSELKDTGVSVTILMPGVTDTNFFNRAEMLDTKAGAMEGKDDPAVVAKAAFEALQAGKDKIVPTVKNKVMSAVAEALPEPLVAAAHRAFSKPGSAG